MRNSASVARFTPFVAPARVSVSWVAIYLSATLIIWTIAPFLRRLMDWKSHFSAISPFAALPMMMLIPAVAMLFASRARSIHRSFEIVALLWVVGFSYALVVAILAGHLLGGVFTFVSFCLPLGFGLWIATCADDVQILYRRISQISIILAVIAGIYGIFQYVALPPWDAAWMRDVNMNSIGEPLPFEVRVFSLLNSPATFAAFLTVATVMFLPRLRLKSGLLLLPIFIGLGLSMVRTAWVTLPLAIVIFAFLTTRKAQLLRGVFVFIGVGVVAIALLQPLFSIGAGSVLQNRLATLTDIGHDGSAADRARQMSEAFTIGLNDPEGNGLGFVGVSTRLNGVDNTATVIDSGYLARFVEMGLPGMITFLASLGFALFAAIRVWRVAIRNGDGEKQDLAALAITMQISLLSLNFFGDASTGVAAMFAWASLGFILRTPLPKRTLQ